MPEGKRSLSIIVGVARAKIRPRARRTSEVQLDISTRDVKRPTATRQPVYLLAPGCLSCSLPRRAPDARAPPASWSARRPLC